MFRLTSIASAGLLLMASAVHAEPMTFRLGGSDARACEGDRPGYCAWVQASGEITPETPEDFRRFVEESDHPVPRLVRLDSLGGNLVGGVTLGLVIRRLGFLTEIGGDAPDADNADPYDWWDFSVRTPGSCVSACAYAFLGGLDRYIEPASRIAFHRFDIGVDIPDVNAELFTAHDLDEIQIMTAWLVLYLLAMDVDPSLIGLASSRGPDELVWLTDEEADDLRVVFQPSRWEPWTIRAAEGGIVASSRTSDASRWVDVTCNSDGKGFVTLNDRNPAITTWFEQSARDGIAGDGSGSVFGETIAPGSTSFVPLASGGAAIRFELPDLDPPLTTPALLHPDAGYFGAGASLDYAGTTDGFEQAVRLALNNCATP